MSAQSDLKKHTIYLTVHGSHAYGTNTPESDMDKKGVFIAPQSYYLGFLDRVEQIEEKDPDDLVIYELRKFFRLAADCNPNIIEVLHTDEADILEITKLGRELRSIGSLFLSQKAKFTFSGYAHSQLARIRAHYRWLKSPPTAPPERADFGLPEYTLIPKDHLSAAEALITKKIDTWDIDWEGFDEAQKIRLQQQIQDYLVQVQVNAGHATVDEMLLTSAARASGLSDNFIQVLQEEKKFSNAQQEWRNYFEWKKNRNPKRAELEAKFGYDTKHAAHLVRLMRMGEEILLTGKVLVKRPDAEELKDLRFNGTWKYDDLVEWAEKKDRLLDEIYKSNLSVLPKTPDRTKLDAICVKLVRDYWDVST